MRDKLKSVEYLKKRYERDTYWLKYAISRYEEVLEIQGIEGPGIRICQIDIIDKSICKLYTAYSLGIDVKDLMIEVNLIIDNTLSSWDGSVYGDIEQALELAIIFDIRSDQLNNLINLLEKYNYKDKFLDLLANYINPEWQIRSDKLQFKKAVGPLVEVIEFAATDKTKAVKRLKTYLEKQWFNMQKEGLITNKDHLKKDKYRGYWCIESAAVVKMLDLDDEILKECKYYPYDLAHYNRD